MAKNDSGKKVRYTPRNTPDWIFSVGFWRLAKKREVTLFSENPKIEEDPNIESLKNGNDITVTRELLVYGENYLSVLADVCSNALNVPENFLWDFSCIFLVVVFVFSVVNKFGVIGNKGLTFISNRNV